MELKFKQYLRRNNTTNLLAVDISKSMIIQEEIECSSIVFLNKLLT